MEKIAYPYMPKNREFEYVSLSNSYMQIAKLFAFSQSLDAVMPNASILVKNNTIIGFGANGSEYHKSHECERVKQNIPTGQGYELCEGCHPKNHSEQRALADARAKGNDIAGATLYLWGHWWCCEPCWNVMIDGGIEKVCILERSEKFFNKNNPENSVGHQFDDFFSKK
ncbi:hypothetical protein IPJ70_02370 [Candidatus Campbellbacteria bacterium]|nr:MAG: hypothetical protein IPJ70_02370 [Candidatus Campbellbacteria bacterium]